MISPTFEEFKSLARRGGGLVPLWVEAPADEATPLALFRALYDKSPACFLLESVEGGEHLGRYSFAAFEPRKIIRTRGRDVFIENGGKKSIQSDDPFNEIRKLLDGTRAPDVKGLPRFYGGAVGYVSYDMVRRFERLPDALPDDLGLPESFFFLTKDLFVFDHVAHTVKLVRTVPVDKTGSLKKIYEESGRDLQRQLEIIKPAAASLKAMESPDKISPPFDTREKKEFIAAVKKAKEYIAAGDIIQVVPSRRMSFPVKAHPLEIYRALRRINPSPYMYFLRDGDTHVIGSSPEMLIRLENGRAETRPIAGTRPRGSSPEADKKLAVDLLADQKERAEHVMLVDLSRNDLGRVCRPGSVEVSNFMNVEKYSHVMHIVSSVTGNLSPKKDAFDLFRATFPAGTLTGAPKIRAMEIIEEIEKSRRGLYGGAVGYFSYTGNMDMAIVIRTILLKAGVAHVQAGAGVVADSVPEKEFEETQNKAAAVVAALRAAGAKI